MTKVPTVPSLPIPMHQPVPRGIALALLLGVLRLPAQPPGQEFVLTFAGVLGCCLLFTAAERALARTWKFAGNVTLLLLVGLTILLVARQLV